MSTIRQLEIEMLKLRLMELQLEQEEKLLKYLSPFRNPVGEYYNARLKLVRARKPVNGIYRSCELEVWKDELGDGFLIFSELIKFPH